MRVSGRCACFLLLLATLTASFAAAECVTSISALSLPTVFPNLRPVALAWNGDRIGVVKSNHATNPALYFALYDDALSAVSGDNLIAPASTSVIGLVWNGQEFALFYRDDKYREVFQRISAAGVPAAAPVLVSGERTGSPQQEYSEFLWIPSAGGGMYAVARTRYVPGSYGLWLSVYARDGSKIFERNVSPTFVELNATPAIAATTSNRIAVVWFGVRSEDVGELQFVSVDTTNPEGALRVRGFEGRDPRIASDGSEFFVLSVGKTESELTEILETRFSADGEKTVDTRDFMSAPRVDVAPVSLFWQGTDYVFTYDDYFLGLSQKTRTYRFRTIRADGTTITDMAVSPVPAYSTFEVTAPLIAIDEGYVGGFGRSQHPADGWHSFLARRCPLDAQLVAPTRAGIGELLSMRVNASGGTAPYSYFWDFGDETVAVGAEVTHRYRTEGEYTIRVSVTDADDNVATMQRVVSVSDSGPPPPPPALAVALTASATSVAPRQGVSFSAQVTGGTAPYSYAWTFGDGTAAAVAQVNHSWFLAGTYVVQLTVRDAAGATQSRSVTISVVASRRSAIRR